MKIRVLVADDHPLVREGVIRALVRDPGIDVVGAAGDGTAAIEPAYQLEPDGSCSICACPGSAARPSLEHLRTQLPEIRALVTTANESPEGLLDAIAAGAAGYLTKDTTGEALRPAVVSTHGGGSVITPRLAAHLLHEFSARAGRGPQPSAR